MVLLFLVIVVALVGFKAAFTQAGNLKTALEKAKKNENILKAKLNVLTESEGNLQSDANSAVAYLPGENPALLVLYQVRKLAADGGLIFSNLAVGSSANDANGLMAVGVSFDLQGSLPRILDYVNSVKNTAPNLKVQNVDLLFSAEVVRATIEVKSFWSPYPTKIPILTEPATALTSSEKEVLIKISGFLPPPFVSLTAGVPRENLNPFGE